MKEISYQFRDKLNQILGGFSHNYCYQCGACVADCPAHNVLPDFNPRTIILKTLYGYEELINTDSIIWNCTNCYNCHERCPQNVSPIEVIIALKNMASQNNAHPKNYDQLIERVRKTGSTVTATSLSAKRRQELNLPEFQMDCLEDLQSIIKSRR